jgi:hypothetical protein
VEKRGGSALNIFSILYTHHRIPNEHMMTINFDTITNNYEVIYVIKTVMKYHLKKILRYEFSSASSKYGSTFICWRHKWRDLVYEYSSAKSPMISGYDVNYVYTFVFKKVWDQFNERISSDIILKVTVKIFTTSAGFKEAKQMK